MFDLCQLSLYPLNEFCIRAKAVKTLAPYIYEGQVIELVELSLSDSYVDLSCAPLIFIHLRLPLNDWCFFDVVKVERTGCNYKGNSSISSSMKFFPILFGSDVNEESRVSHGLNSIKCRLIFFFISLVSAFYHPHFNHLHFSICHPPPSSQHFTETPSES